MVLGFAWRPTGPSYGPLGPVVGGCLLRGYLNLMRTSWAPVRLSPSVPGPSDAVGSLLGRLAVPSGSTGGASG
eukprot:2818162-Pyramimonas_sp.AAC.1